jgi:hypothetical protein
MIKTAWKVISDAVDTARHCFPVLFYGGNPEIILYIPRTPHVYKLTGQQKLFAGRLSVATPKAYL